MYIFQVNLVLVDEEEVLREVRDSLGHLVDLTGIFDWDPSDLTGEAGASDESRLIIS